jgi:hypothetical protein
VKNGIYVGVFLKAPLITAGSLKTYLKKIRNARRDVYKNQGRTGNRQAIAMSAGKKHGRKTGEEGGPPQAPHKNT